MTLRCVGQLITNQSLQYFLELKVGFPGIGNDLKVKVPIIVTSSMLRPGSGAWDGPPRELDLPPYVIQIFVILELLKVVFQCLFLHLRMEP